MSQKRWKSRVIPSHRKILDPPLRGGGRSQVKIDDVILEHICWKIPKNNLIYIKLNSYSEYSSRGLWSPTLEIHWLIGFSEVSFLNLMMIFVPKTIIKRIWNSPTKQYRNLNYVFKYYASEALWNLRFTIYFRFPRASVRYYTLRALWG